MAKITASSRLQAFENLQRSLKLSKKQAAKWIGEVRAIRQASSARRLRQRGLSKENRG
jgi:hypothetical protein